MESWVCFDRAEFDRIHGQSVLENLGLRAWLLQCRVTKKQKERVAADIVRHFWNCAWPPQDIEQVFGIEFPAHGVPERLSDWRLGNLVGGVWSQLKQLAPSATEKNVLQALLQGNLPDTFRKWVHEVAKHSASNAYVRELVHRNAWDRIPWDYAMLHAFCSDYAKVSTCGWLSQKPGNTRFTVVWVKLPPRRSETQSERMKIDSLRDAVSLSLLEERFATWDALWKLIAKSHWVEHSCNLLRSLREDVTLFAEPAQNYVPDASRINWIASRLACDEDGVSVLAIPGKALLVRKDATDFKAATAEKLCHFLEDLFWLAESSFDAMKAARSHWPSYCIGDKLLPNGAFEVPKPENVPLLDPLVDQVEPPVCTHEVPDCRMQGPSSVAKVELCVLQLSRSPAVFHECMASSTHLHTCKHALQQAGLDYRLPCGAYCFVDPEVYPSIVEYFEAQEVRLGHSHIIASLCYQNIVMRTINSLPRKYKLCIRRSELLEVPTAPENAAVDEEEEANENIQVVIQVVIKRDFIHVPISSSLRTEPSDGSRTVSTTDARPGCQNPRRAVASNRSFNHN